MGTDQASAAARLACGGSRARRGGGPAWWLSLAVLSLAAGAGCRHETTELQFRLGPADQPAEALRAAQNVIETRVNLSPFRARVLVEKPDLLLLRLPPTEPAAIERLKKLVCSFGRLEFRVVAGRDSEPYADWQQTGIAPPGYTVYTIKARPGEPGSRDEKILVNDRCDMTGAEIVRTRVNPPGQGGSLRGFSVALAFSPKGETGFARLTGDHIGERLAIVLNTVRDKDGRIAKDQPGTCDSAPVIRTRVFGDAVIEGDFDPQGAADLRAILTSGSLPAPLRFDKQVELPPPAPPQGVEKIENKNP